MKTNMCHNVLNISLNIQINTEILLEEANICGHNKLKKSF